MRKNRIRVSFLAPLLLSTAAHSIPITYEFHGKGTYTDVYGTPPPIPAELETAQQWDIYGSIIVDNEAGAVYDDPYIRMGQQIVGGSLSVNGLSTGAFSSANFRYYFFDGFEESSRPYDASFELFFDAGEDIGPSSMLFYTEDLDWNDSPGSGPNLEGIAFDDVSAFLGAVKPGNYSETAFTLGDGLNRWDLNFNPTTEFLAQDTSTPVPEPGPAVLLAAGLAAIFYARRRYGEKHGRQ